MGVITDYKNETNQSALKKLYRAITLSCGYCPPNRVENMKRNNQRTKRHLSWKLTRRKQFLTKQS